MGIGNGRIEVIGVKVVLALYRAASRRRLRCSPGMLGTDVVRHHVQQDLQSKLMGRGNEVLKILHGAEVVFDGIFVDRAVAVIIGGGVVVVVRTA